MIPALLALTLGAANLTARPPALTFAPGASAEVELTLSPEAGSSGEKPKISLTASVGEMTSLGNLGGGRYRARYLPPKEHFPQVALLLAEVTWSDKVERAWLSLPLSANARLSVDTKPRASVKVKISSKVYGPLTADGRGHLALQVTVPPGEASASVEAVDRATNTTESKLDLGARPYARVRAVLSRPEVPVVGANETLIELFAVDGAGAPLQSGASLRLTSERGSVDPLVQTGAGVFVARYHPPRAVGNGADVLTLSTEGASLATPLKVPLRPGPASGAVVELDPATYVAGTKTPVKVRAHAVDVNGNEISGSPPVLSADLGTLSGAGAETLWALPDVFGGHNEAHVSATVGGARGDGKVALRAGDPVAAQLELPKGYARAGTPIEGDLRVTDAFGNPVEHASLTASAGGRGAAVIRDLGQGRYGLTYTADPADPPGPLTLQVRAGSLQIAQAEGPQLLPYWRPWSVSAAVFAAGQTNASKAWAFSPRLSLGLRVNTSAFEILLEGGPSLYMDFTLAPGIDTNGGQVCRTNPCNGTQVTVNGSLSAWSGMAGTRFNFPVGPRTALHGEFLLGLQATRATTDSLPQTNFASFALRAGGGMTYWLGTNRLLVQLEYIRVQVDPSSGYNISGNIGGLSIALGYVFSF